MADFDMSTVLARQILQDVAAKVAAKQPSTDVVSEVGECFRPDVPQDPTLSTVWELCIFNVCKNPGFTWQIAAQAVDAYRIWAEQEAETGIYVVIVSLRNPNIPERQPGWYVGGMSLVENPRQGVIEGESSQASNSMSIAAEDCPLSTGSEATA